MKLKTFIAKICEKESMSKRLNKYIASFDYFLINP